MKITPTPHNSTLNAISSVRSPAGAQAGSSASSKSTVELSPAARQLASLQNGDNDVDLERVQQIRDAIASGQLKVDAGRVADSLLASVRELLK
ncbi:FlgM family anti-sigma-28 factor [Pusillimonas noertemannii]|uniref:Negative regulator of flagellin synthesis n=1 Tax=Pusillimonas noertemannii TaxID=305977 RepID=A0A2U1CSU5_9BURK|nr:flagellar biosynthesis anti-sigma factor FlgM [Pusillimonas noertemannii]NYT68196.1 flagellar biosynthesis anti-sigma factor FlgM [Pusillimonas noertemannii]PVY68871.1 FlgM family anti-sigma-28 factor [Pusillimonas noertemannii]TFL11677.1 flagellar biosynthesis anti-sigma factor FlgM [Pusillimonas noertemannii]